MQSNAPGLSDVSALVIAGGQGRRLGGTEFGDKMQVLVDGRRLIDIVLASIPDDVGVVLVGPELETERPVLQVQERPIGGGPLAAIAAGVEVATTPWVAIVPGDAPRAGLSIEPLAAAIGDGDVAAVAESTSGRLHPLIALWRRAALVGALGTVSPLTNRAASTLYRSLRPITVVDEGCWGLDVNSPADLARESGG